MAKRQKNKDELERERRNAHRKNLTNHSSSGNEKGGRKNNSPK